MLKRVFLLFFILFNSVFPVSEQKRNSLNQLIRQTRRAIDNDNLFIASRKLSKAKNQLKNIQDKNFKNKKYIVLNVLTKKLNKLRVNEKKKKSKRSIFATPDYELEKGVILKDYNPKRDKKYVYDILADNYLTLLGSSHFDGWELETFVKPYLIFKIMFIDNIPAGIINFDPKTGSIKLLYIEYGFRKQGYASKLVNYVIHELKKRNLNKVATRIDPENIPSINLFKKLGFKQDKKASKPGVLIFEKKI